MALHFCTKCVNISTRPRITFDERGVCNACQWDETKRTKIDWKTRWRELEKICDRYRNKDSSNWDVIAACSGGKDGSHVAWKLKHELGMHPLCVTLLPPIQTEIGRQNLKNFKKSGFDHIAIEPNPKIYSRFALRGFKEEGQPKLPFVDGVTTVIIKIAMKFNIPFIMYGEEGESEYGGAMTQSTRRRIDREYFVNYYFSGHDTTEYLDEFTEEELIWWLLPNNEEMVKTDLFPTHWSQYEFWDPYEHYLSAKKNCGFQTLPTRSIGTYTNFAQLDDDLQDLHAYLMFLKFGFGRATSDTCIDIRRGAMDRKQGIALIRKYDGEYPEALVPQFLDYYGITQEEFDTLIDKFANKELLEKVNGRWRKKFEVR